MKPIPRHSRQRPRHGAVIIVAVVCLVLVSMFGASLLKSAATEQRLSRREVSRVQAHWLAEAGLERAVTRLHADQSYRGEEWMVSAAELGGEAAGLVVIAVEPDAEAGRARVVATAAFPRETPLRARVTRRITVPMRAEKR